MPLPRRAHRAFRRRYASKFSHVFLLYGGADWLTQKQFETGWLAITPVEAAAPYGACRTVDEFLIAANDSGLGVVVRHNLGWAICTHWDLPEDGPRRRGPEIALAAYRPDVCERENTRRL